MQNELSLSRMCGLDQQEMRTLKKYENFGKKRKNTRKKENETVPDQGPFRSTCVTTFLISNRFISSRNRKKRIAYKL